MAIGDIGEVPYSAWGCRDSASFDDCWTTRRECQPGMVDRLGQVEQRSSDQSCRDRVSVDDGARGEHGHCNVHAKRSVWQDRMRVDRVGVGDVSEVPAGAWSRGHSSICDDGRAAGRKCE